MEAGKYHTRVMMPRFPSAYGIVLPPGSTPSEWRRSYPVSREVGSQSMCCEFGRLGSAQMYVIPWAYECCWVGDFKHGGGSPVLLLWHVFIARQRFLL